MDDGPDEEGDPGPAADSQAAGSTAGAGPSSGDEFPTPSPGSGVSRRGMLTYGGGAALVTWLGIGAGWYVFIREPTGPEEDVVREYVDAIDRSHFYTAQELFHENAPDEAWRPEEIPDVDRVDVAVEDTEVVDRETEPETAGVEEVALVHADVSIDDGTRSELLELAFIVVRNEEGEWKMWRDS